MTYQINDHTHRFPKKSGTLKGNGTTVGRLGSKRNQLVNFPNINWTDISRIKKEISNYDPSITYNRRELMLLTEKILLEDPKDPRDYPMFLNGDMYMRRLKKEIYSASGRIDPSIQSGIYNRTHPAGRKFRQGKGKNKEGFYL